jgi:uncharacterized protein YbbK (DUF523 family)
MDDKKVCTGCQEPRLKTDFGHHRARCKWCRRKETSAYYKTHSQKMRKQSNIASKKLRSGLYDKFILYLQEHPCIDCGEKDVEVLECDHVRGTKIGNIGNLIKRNFSWIKIEEELAKCEVRCANCHRRRTNRQFGYRRFSQFKSPDEATSSAV